MVGTDRSVDLILCSVSVVVAGRFIVKGFIVLRRLRRLDLTARVGKARRERREMKDPLPGQSSLGVPSHIQITYQVHLKARRHESGNRNK
jgi:hypothetical protein